MKEGELGKVYSNGEVICKEGDKGEVMYVIQSGRVKITKKTSSGDFTLTTLKSGDIFGDMALFDRLPRSATAVAAGDARVLSIDKEKLISTVSRDPTLVFKLIETMSQRIRRLTDDLMRLKEDTIDIVHACMDVDEICNLILDEARNIIPADNGSVMLLDNDGKSLSIKAAFGTEYDSKVKFSVGEGIAGDVLRTGRAELVNNAIMDSRFKSGGASIKSILCVPLKCRDHNFGVINMSNKGEKFFAIDDLKLLNTVSIHASIAIENGKNFSDLKNATDKLLRNATLQKM
jgi:CRP-like cAMP-binding protein